MKLSVGISVPFLFFLEQEGGEKEERRKKAEEGEIKRGEKKKGIVRRVSSYAITVHRGSRKERKRGEGGSGRKTGGERGEYRLFFGRKIQRQKVKKKKARRGTEEKGKKEREKPAYRAAVFLSYHPSRLRRTQVGKGRGENQKRRRSGGKKGGRERFSCSVNRGNEKKKGEGKEGSSVAKRKGSRRLICVSLFPNSGNGGEGKKRREERRGWHPAQKMKKRKRRKGRGANTWSSVSSPL